MTTCAISSILILPDEIKSIDLILYEFYFISVFNINLFYYLIKHK